jgi:hypothetical protein
MSIYAVSLNVIGKIKIHESAGPRANQKMKAPRPVLFFHVRIVLNRRLRRRQEGVEALLDDGVALARSLFEAGAIEDLHISPMISDEANLLQRLRRKRHRLASGA